MFYVICDNIRSLYNIGSIFRTADGAGVDKIFLCGISGTPPNHKIEKVSLGAEKTVPWEHHWQTWRVVEKLKKEGFCIIALENGKNIINNYNYRKFKLPRYKRGIALIVGNEVSGISSKILTRCDKAIYIPMHGQKKSLNVAVAFGVAAYEIKSKL